MAQVIILWIGADGAQIHLGEWDGRSLRVHAIILDIGASPDQHRILKQVIGRAVFLEDDHDMLNCWDWRWDRDGDALAPATPVQAQKKCAATQQKDRDT